ncbi:hypothetical protein AADG42_13915 [Ammonicoccus fulvus]|uniref:Uncharacterized protein n=1 Tax=Ammonicoccus fulvus TaxID=3138240 RepID=A0ABZ3FUG7_9ACTN
MADRRQEDYDRDFAAMVSGIEMDPLPQQSPSPTDTTELAEPPDFRIRRGVTPPRRIEDFNLSEALERAEPDEPDPSEYQPPPLPPMRRPRGLPLFGWLCAAYVLAALVLTIVGVRLPSWAGWAAVVAFVAAVVIGWRSLPKHRDPGDGDGAVV